MAFLGTLLRDTAAASASVFDIQGHLAFPYPLLYGASLFLLFLFIYYPPCDTSRLFGERAVFVIFPYLVSDFMFRFSICFLLEDAGEVLLR